MATAAISTAADPGILLEAGTNEVEILVFKVAGRLCGVNVAKVREVRTHQTLTFLPQANAALAGVVCIRDVMVPLVNLRQMLWGVEVGSQSTDTDKHLLLEYNDQVIAFRVEGVDRIHRVSWKDFIPLPQCPGMVAPVTGIIFVAGRIVTVLDFEAIGEVLGMNGTPYSADATAAASNTSAVRPPIIFADDSLLIRKMLDDALLHAGYEDRRGFADGQEAWEYLIAIAYDHSTESIHEAVAGVISDVEMPRMDGFTLTRRIRANPVLKNLPVVLFSSLISKDNEKKGQQVGATAQISKPRWEELTTTLTNVLGDVVG